MATAGETVTETNPIAIAMTKAQCAVLDFIWFPPKHMRPEVSESLSLEDLTREPTSVSRVVDKRRLRGTL